jgi:hypothetical protein
MLYYIYKIVCEDTSVNYRYVGSTRAFKERKYLHKSRCNNEKPNEYNNKLYKTIRENGGWNNWRIIVIAEVEVESKRQAEIIEEEHRLKLEANLNERRCYRTEEQRIEQNREHNKEYYKNNTEKIKEQQIEYYENNTEKIKARHREYRENNTNKIKARQKEYQKTNAEKIREWGNTKCNCECGGKYTNQNKAKHLNSKKHKKYLMKIKDL